ncbi:c-type cytochrome biogenesis protein CcmI [Pantoea sp. BRM17]|nr:c-type cytochrome biogenesis protein CcmI [Pantoea sp. BRM17]
MIVFCMTLIVLLAAAVALFLAAGWHQREYHADERDRLNTAFYQQRLRELQRDDGQEPAADSGLHGGALRSLCHLRSAADARDADFMGRSGAVCAAGRRGDPAA